MRCIGINSIGVVVALLANLAWGDTARPPLEINYRTKLISKVLIGDRNGEFKRTVERIMNRLAMDGDHTDYKVEISPSLAPNAKMDVSIRKITINLGLLAWCHNEDELAAVIAHEMTHGNWNQLKIQRQNREIDDILSKVTGYAGLDNVQQEELRADLGAMERLIHAGYNPWAHHAFEKRFAKFAAANWDLKLVRFLYAHAFHANFDFLEDHPSSEVRMEAAVQYLYYADHKDHLRGYAKHYTPFSLGMKRVRATVKPMTGVLLSPHVVRGMLGWTALTASSSLGLGDQLPVLGDINEVVRATNAAVLNPLYNHIVDPLLSAAQSQLEKSAPTPNSTTSKTLLYLTAGTVLAGGVAMAELVRETIVDEFRRLPGADKPKSIAAQIADMECSVRKATLHRPVEQRVIEDFIWSLAILGSELEGGYNEYAVRAYPLLTGVPRLKRRLLRLHHQVLTELSMTMASISPEQLQKNGDKIRHRLDGLRPFAYEDATCESLLIKIADQLQLASPPVVNQSRSDASDSFEFRIRTRQRMKHLANLSPAEKIDLVGDLHRAELVDSAIGIFAAHYDALTAFVWSPTNDDIGRTKTLEQVAVAAMSRGTLANVSQWQKHRWRRMLLKSKLRQANASAADKMPLRGLERQVATTYSRFDVMHQLMMRGDRMALRAFLSRSFHSVSGFSQWITQEVAPKNVILDHFRDEFYQVLVEHPQWLKTAEDVRALLETECFWPTFDEQARPTDIEWSLWKALQDHREKYSSQWKYDPGKAKVLHHMVLKRLTELDRMPKRFSSKLRLFYRMTDRGLTAASDGYFATIYQEAVSPQEISELTKFATSSRVWEPQLRAKLTRERIRQSDEYRALLVETDPKQRNWSLLKILDDIKYAFPERGMAYVDLLEELSRDINSTRDESAWIAHRKEQPGSEKSVDFTLRSLSAIGEKALSWSKAEQWELILFLRGDIDATAKLKKSFRTVGPERVRRSFLLLPEAAKTAIIHGFIASPRGLLPDVNLRSGYSKKVIRHLLRDADPQTREVAIEVLDAFMFALGQVGVGKENYRSLLLANLLAHPRDAKRRAGHILKDVLEQFGTTGIKIGQFLAAAEILPPEDTAILRDLQNNALPPEREHIYRDFRELAPHLLDQYSVRNLLGSASMKYGVRAVNIQTGEQRALKVLREGAIAHTDLEFDVLHHMSDRLARRDHARYGVFRAMAKASITAVRRELSLEDEVMRSRIAATEIYGDRSTDDLIVRVPASKLVNSRIIDEEFAEGVAVHELDATYQQPMAEALVAMERDILWANKPIIHYDPDRHAKNYCNYVEEGGPNGNVGVIAPIDFGQVQSMTRTQRGILVELFALAQVLRGAGPTQWSLDHAGNVLQLNAQQRAKLQKNLNVYFKSPRMSEVAAYYALLAALDEAGHEVDEPNFSFVRGIVQLEQYKPLLSPEARKNTAKSVLTHHVTDRANQLREELKNKMSPGEKFNYARRNMPRLPRRFNFRIK